MSTHVRSWRPSTRTGAKPCSALTTFSTSSTSVRTWRVLGALVITNASTTPKRSPMARTTVSCPTLASAASAAGPAAGCSWTCTSTSELNGARPGFPPSVRTPRRGWSNRRWPSAAGPGGPASARPGARPSAGPPPGTRVLRVRPAAPSPWLARRSSAHRVQTQATHATDNGFRHESLHRPALQEQVTDLGARNRLVGPIDPDDPPAGRDGRGRRGRAGHHGQRDQGLEVVGPVPGPEFGDQVRPDHQVEIGRAHRGEHLLGGVARVAGPAPVDLEPAGLGRGDLVGQGNGEGVAVLGG